MINRPLLDSQLMLDEGLRLQAYKDTRGFLTVGVGRNLDANPLSPAELAVVGHDARTLPITQDQAMFLLHNDEMKSFTTLTNNLPWWPRMDDVRARVCVDLDFNMGWDKFQKFKQFFNFMATGDFDGAANDLMGTAWYGEVGNRGPRLVNMVRTGEDFTA